MSRIVLSLVLCGTVATPPAVVAQDHVAVGAYADYFRLSQTDTNFVGVGGRLGVGLGHRVMLEAEMSYDFNQVFTENFDNGGTIIVNRSNLRPLHGLFRPRLALGHTNVHPCRHQRRISGRYDFDTAPATPGTFFSSVENLRDKNVMGSVYPGGGLEGPIGPVGPRLDVGDEIYFNGGAHHDFRASFGPYIRF
jgi:hypothetical protein